MDKSKRKRIKSEPIEKKIKVEPNDATASSPNADIPSTSFVKPLIDFKAETKNKKKAKGSLAQKLIASRPYNLFLTCVTSAPQTHTEPLSLTFIDILNESSSEMECSVQINYSVQADWLFSQYTLAGHMDKPLLIIYGQEECIVPVLSTISKTKPQVTAKFKYNHHSKMMLFGYKDGSMRVVVSAANLTEEDWNNRTQGHWISEKLDALPEQNDQTTSESPTGFRKDLLNYLSKYELKELQPWIKRIQNTNFTPVNVFLVTSIPGTHPQTYDGFHEYGHGRVAQLLSDHLAPIGDRTSIVAQTSALGVYKRWLREEFAGSFGSSNINIIYPSQKNVSNSYGGSTSGGSCLHYDDRRHRQQKWVKDYLYEWRAESRHRSRAMPHIKTYCRLSDKKLYWFILTSANLSKSAWGATEAARYNPKRYRKSRYWDYYDDSDEDEEEDEDALEISNYEVGVLFMPKFVTNTTYFSLTDNDKSTPVFPLPYDLPLTMYAANDVPYFSD